MCVSPFVSEEDTNLRFLKHGNGFIIFFVLTYIGQHNVQSVQFGTRHSHQNIFYICTPTYNYNK